MPIDTSALLAADQLREELEQELGFSEATGVSVDTAVVDRALSSARADIAEAFTLVDLLNTGAIGPGHQDTVSGRISELSGRATAVLQSARSTAFGKPGDAVHAPQQVDLFAAVNVRVDEVDVEVTQLRSSVEPLASVMPGLVRPIQQHLGEISSYLAQARTEARAGVAAQLSGDHVGAVARKQAAEAALDRASAILHHDMQQLRATAPGEEISQAQPGPLGAPTASAGPGGAAATLSQLGPGALVQQVVRDKVVDWIDSHVAPPSPGHFSPTQSTEFGKGVFGSRKTEQWISSVLPHLQPGETLRFITSISAPATGGDGHRIFAVTDRRLLVLGDAAWTSLSPQAALRFAATGPEIYTIDRSKYTDFLSISWVGGRAKIGTPDKRDFPALERYLLALQGGY